MGRREKPVDPTAGPVQRLAHELRKLRQEAGGITYRAMAQRVPYSVPTLSQAAAGEKLPSLPVTLAYVEACGGDAAEWELRWRQVDEELAARSVAGGGAGAPYRGLARFEADDHARFFGRDALTGALVQLVREHRVAALFGPSGSGKSSLLRAGLIPRLRHAGEPGPRPAALRILTPGPHPVRSHEQLFAPVGAGGDVWLIVDQFEELFTLCADADERGRFIDLLLTAEDPGSRLRVVLGVRADFYPRCAEHRGLVTALQHATLMVGPMTPAELREAIVRPAAADDLVVERALTNRLMGELADAPGGLPLLSHALLETWRRRRGRTMTVAAYEAAGGVHGAVAQTAEDVYTRLSPAQARLARRILLRLIAPGEGTQDTRRPVPHGELDTGDAAGTRIVLERLARARLVTLDDGIADLAHEALIASWPRLRGWIEEHRERLRLHRKLTEAAQAWEELRHDVGVLYRGARLAAAKDAFAAPQARAELTALEGRFLDASIAAAMSEQTAVRRRTRRLRQLVALLTTAVVVASVSTVLAFRAQWSSDRERDLAVSRQVAIEAMAQRATTPALAAQLGLAAYRLAPTAEALGAVLSTFATPYAHRLTGSADAAAFSPDGRTLATATEDHTVRLWRLTGPGGPTGLATLTGHSDTVRSVRFSPDGRLLATAAVDRTIRLWDVTRPDRPHRLATLGNRTDNVWSVAFSPDGRTLAVAGDDRRTVRLWNVADPRHPDRLASLIGHADTVLSVAFGPDGHTLATAGDDHTARLWDVTDPRDPRGLATLHGHTDTVWSAVFSPDGRTLATAGADRTARLWNVADRRHPRPLGTLTGHTDAVRSAAFSPDGHTLATAGNDHTARLWDLTDPEHPHHLTTLIGHTDNVVLAAFGPQGRTLATVGDDNTARLWDIPGPILTGHTDGLYSAAFAPDGRALATAGIDHTVRLWNVADPGHPQQLATLTGHAGTVRSAVFSPDGHTLATTGDDRTARLWDVSDLRHPSAVATLHGHKDTVWKAAFSPDGRTLATTSEDATVRLWDVTEPRRPTLAAVLTGHHNNTEGAAFAPDGRVLATTSQDRTVRLWDISDRRHPHTLAVLTGHTQSIRCAAFSPDGHTLATASLDGTARLWDVGDPRQPHRLAVLTGHTNAVYGVAFNHDGHVLATASADTTARLWNVTDPGRPTALATLTGHTDRVYGLAFGPDGHTLATAGADATARLWETDPTRAAARICATAHPPLTRSDWDHFFAALPYRPPC
ncbi:hypothetical protein MOV08_01375 [Streptomyces yunnanensis]|uniref:HTH cro/C1-type domain-containing protein n=1 Tax=Streptomyces yunnanensis TaxID=156453 RepID=A0ABY8A1B5_9ACTN|nr:hypothetical protein [Streptomyces yunnanensis]WEB38091.1 hypothetical protein MOV08_01375 [Streptomyces yunnanensis]